MLFGSRLTHREADIESSLQPKKARLDRGRKDQVNVEETGKIDRYFILELSFLTNEALVYLSDRNSAFRR